MVSLLPSGVQETFLPLGLVHAPNDEAALVITGML